MIKNPNVLYLTEGDLSVYKDGQETMFPLAKGFGFIAAQIEIRISSKEKIRFVIDCYHQDIFQEKIPPLLPWDLLRFLFHKRATYASQGGYVGFSLFKEKKDLYLQGIHIAKNHPLYEWVSWVKGRKGKIFFAPLEGIAFLKTYDLPQRPYQMLTYPFKLENKQLLVFSGKRVLFSRSYVHEEECKRALHFLSRNFPDIEANIKRVDSEILLLLNFISRQQRGALPIISLSFPRSSLVFLLTGCFLGGIVLWSAVEGYYGLRFKTDLKPLLSEIKQLKSLPYTPPKENIPSLRKALKDFRLLEPTLHNPLKDLEKLAETLRDQPIHMQTVSWNFQKTKQLSLMFILEENNDISLVHLFNKILGLFRKTFPTATLEILSAPYKSGIHETFKGKSMATPAFASIKLTLP